MKENGYQEHEERDVEGQTELDQGVRLKKKIIK